MGKIAYIISAYKDANHLSNLIKALDFESDFYIHIDANVAPQPFIDAVGAKAVFVPSCRVSWGGVESSRVSEKASKSRHRQWS